MPFPLIPTALGVCFLLVWAFIGGMMFRDSQIAARRDRDMDGNILPLDPFRRGPVERPGSRQVKNGHRASVRAAS